MTSADGEKPSIGLLLRATESNLKRIEAVSCNFLAPVLNEWRYATRHIATLLDAPSDESERGKAIGHLERAYLDSCEILLSILLDSCRDFREQVGDYADVLRTFVKDYDSWLAKIRNAQKAQGESADDDRFGRARRLASCCDDLIAFLDVVDVCKDDLFARIAKERRRDRRDGILLACAVLGTIFGVIELVIRCFS
jgi:hypothetical protein